MRRSIAALVATALILTGCSVAPKANSKPAETPTQGTVRVLIFGGPGYDQQLITGFKNAQPGITVEPVTLPDDDYDGLMAKLKSGEIKVDAIVGPGNPFLFAQGVVAPLDDLIQKNKLDLAPFGTAIDFGKYQGKTYGLPVSLSPMTVVYNTDVFEKLGIPAPKAGWTWDDFADTARKLGPEFAAPGKYATAIAPWNLPDLLLSSGKGPVDPDLTAFGAMLNRIHLWTLVDRTVPLDQLGDSESAYFQKFGKGDIGMLLGYWNYSFGHDKPAVKWSVAPFPGNGGTPAIATLAMIAAKAENPETAAAFVKFAVSSDGGVTVAKMPGAPVPGYVDDNSKHVWLANSGLPQESDFMLKLKYIPPTEYPDQLAVSVVKQLDAVLYKGVSPADAVKAYQQERETVMAKK